MGSENGASPPSAPTDPACFFCGATTDREHLCYGCNRFICDTCQAVDGDADSGPWGIHTANDHAAARQR